MEIYSKKCRGNWENGLVEDVWYRQRPAWEQEGSLLEWLPGAPVHGGMIRLYARVAEERCGKRVVMLNGKHSNHDHAHPSRIE